MLANWPSSCVCGSHLLGEKQLLIICYMQRTKMFGAGTSVLVPHRRPERRQGDRCASCRSCRHCGKCRHNLKGANWRSDRCLEIGQGQEIDLYIYILVQSIINGWVLDSGMRNDNGHHIGREHAERQWQKSMRLPGMHACANVCVLCNHHMHAHDTCWQPSVRKLGLSYGWVMNELFWVTFELPALIST